MLLCARQKATCWLVTVQYVSVLPEIQVVVLTALQSFFIDEHPNLSNLNAFLKDNFPNFKAWLGLRWAYFGWPNFNNSSKHIIFIGVRKGQVGLDPPWILKFDIFLLHFLQKGCFISFEREKWNFTNFSLLEKFFLLPWKKPLLPTPPWQNPSDVIFLNYLPNCLYALVMHCRRWLSYNVLR